MCVALWYAFIWILLVYECEKIETETPNQSFWTEELWGSTKCRIVIIWLTVNLLKSKILPWFHYGTTKMNTHLFNFINF